MPEKTGKTFVGFGFGAIQAGLFVYEAYASRAFTRYVLVDVDGELVEAIRTNGGRYSINIARPDRIDSVTLEGIELYNPSVEADRRTIVEAVSRSDEMASALPSVQCYDGEGPTAPARLIAEGLLKRSPGTPVAVYAAENDNRAAEMLCDAVARHGPPETLENVAVLNTVIGKMSGVITDSPTIERLGLARLAPGIGRAILVEEFNRILISRVGLKGHTRGIDVFIEKDDLLPFEEAKLYGHNAVHAMMGYLADRKSLTTMAQAGQDAEILQAARGAFVNESGASLIRKHEGIADPLFTPEGYRQYAEDLLRRMTNPNLNDLVARVCRDPVRKLGWDDRLYGTMRLALQHGVEPRCLALGAAAAVLHLRRHRLELQPPMPAVPENREELNARRLGELLMGLWKDPEDPIAERLVLLTWEALQQLG